MSSKGSVGVTFIICVIAIMLTSYHFTYTGDIVASVAGYFTSLVLLPIILAITPSGVLVAVKPDNFNLKQKWWLFMAPLLSIIIFLGYFYWAMQYGNH
ncbi:MAG: hypothetical protein ACI9YH_004422 [Colwellia sp.]|jgi:hypothetical protein